MKLRSASFHFGHKKMDVIVLDDKGKLRKIQVSWKNAVDPLLPPDHWKASAFGECKHQEDQETLAAAGYTKIPGF